MILPLVATVWMLTATVIALLLGRSAGSADRAQTLGAEDRDKRVATAARAPSTASQLQPTT